MLMSWDFMGVGFYFLSRLVLHFFVLKCNAIHKVTSTLFANGISLFRTIKIFSRSIEMYT